MRENLKNARKSAGLTQQAMEDAERKERAKRNWIEANRKLLHYQSEAYFALVELLDANDLLQ